MTAETVRTLLTTPGATATIEQNAIGQWVARVEQGATLLAVVQVSGITAEHELMLARDPRNANTVLHQLAS